jgi:glycosyltransferase involved in cell wall biosynthesis
MKNPPLVSIVLIFWNAEKFFGEAIASVVQQTYPHWELLLVDDGSTDHSTAMAQSAAARYPGKVRYLEHAGHGNRGKSTSRNLGIQKARGEYVTFLDADDVFLPDKLERQVAILASHPEAAMVYGRTLYWYSWTGNPADHGCDRMGKLGVEPATLFQPPALLTRFLRDGGMVPCICSVLARRQVVVGIEGFTETIQHLYEDQVFLAKMCLAAPVYVEPDCGERYRQHPDSSSAIAMRAGAYDPRRPNPARQAFLQWLGQYLVARGEADMALHQALHRALRPYQYPRLYRLLTPMLALGLHLRGYGSLVKRRLRAGQQAGDY